MDWLNEDSELVVKKMERLQASVAKVQVDNLTELKEVAKIAVIGLLEIAKQLAIGNMEVEEGE